MSGTITPLAIGADFAAFHRRHDADVQQICARLARNGAEGAELAQDAWVRLWEQRARLAGVRDEGAWVRTVAANVARNALRDTRRRNRFAEPMSTPPDFSAAQRPVLATPVPMLRLDLEQAIAALPARAREIYLLHDVEGYDHGEIAERMHLSPGTVRGQLHRARTLLREALTGAPLPSHATRRARGRTLMVPAVAAALALLAGSTIGVRGSAPGAARRSDPAAAMAALDEDRFLLGQIDAMIPGASPARVAALRALRVRLDAIVRREASPPQGEAEREALAAERDRLHAALQQLSR